MTVLWKYLLLPYIKVLLLAVTVFIAILVVGRLDHVAYFITMGTPLSTICLFTLYQIPYVLPLALPLSSLLSSLLLFRQISRGQELTSLRSSGYSLATILRPILFAASLLFCMTFFITSELATTAHLKTRQMLHQFGAVNPLVLLQNRRVAQLQGAYVAMEPIKAGEEARNLVMAVRLKDRLALYLAHHVQLDNHALIADGISLLFHANGQLIIENERAMRTQAADLAFLLRPKGWKIANDHLDFGLLRARWAYLRALGGSRMEKNLMKGYSEVVRRFSLSFAAFTFTLMGALLGVEIGRKQHRWHIPVAALLSAGALISFFIAHELDHLFWASTLLLILPHCLIVLIVARAFMRIERGLE